MSLNNIEGLREMLAEQLEMTINGEQKSSVLDSIANAAGKMVNTAKIQLEYAKMTGHTPQIEFLDGDWLKK